MGLAGFLVGLAELGGFFQFFLFAELAFGLDARSSLRVVLKRRILRCS
jgi:hypothetical protein